MCGHPNVRINVTSWYCFDITIPVVLTASSHALSNNLMRICIKLDLPLHRALTNHCEVTWSNIYWKKMCYESMHLQISGTMRFQELCTFYHSTWSCTNSDLMFRYDSLHHLTLTSRFRSPIHDHLLVSKRLIYFDALFVGFLLEFGLRINNNCTIAVQLLWSGLVVVIMHLHLSK